MDNDIRRIAACVSENLCVQNGVIYEAENPVSLAELGMEDEGGDDLGTKLVSLGFQRVQKTPDIMGFGMKMSDGRFLVIWDSENPGEGQWSVVSGSEVQPAEEEPGSDMTPEQQTELEAEYANDAKWDAMTMDADQKASQAPRAASQGI